MMTLLLAATVLVLAAWIALPAVIWPAAREARLAAVPLAAALTGIVVTGVALVLLSLGPLAPLYPDFADPYPMQHLWQSLLVAGLAQIGLAGLGLIATGAGWRRLAITGASAAHVGIGVLITTRLLPTLLPPRRYMDYETLALWLDPLVQAGVVLLGAGLVAMVLALVFRLIARLTGG